MLAAGVGVGVPFVGGASAYWDTVNLFFGQAGFDAYGGLGKTLASTSVLQSLNITNTVATTNPPGTVVLKDGTVGYGAHNLLARSGDFTQTWTYPAGSHTTGQPDSSGGTNAVRVFAANGSVQQTTAFAASGKTITVLARIKATSADANFRLWVTHQGVADYFSSNLTASSSWQWFAFTQTFTVAAGNIYAGAREPSSGNPDFLVDAFVLVYGTETAAQYPDRYVPTTTAAVYAPRLTYERGATSNWIKDSGDLSIGNWNRRGTATAAAGAARANGVVMSMITLGAIGTNDIYNLVGTAVFAATARAEPGFWIEPVSTTGTLKITQAAGGAAAGNWSVDLSKLSSGPQWVTRSHPAVSISIEFNAAADGNFGLQWSALSGSITAYVAACVAPGTLPPTAYLRTFATAPLYTAGTPKSQNLATGSGTQSVTVVPGCVYTVIHQAGGTYTLSGAGSGTTTAGTATRVVATTSTLTLTVTSAPTLLQVYEGAADLAYVSGPYSEYPQAGLLREVARTNLALWCRDLTNAAWTASSVTVAKTATGIDGIANSASTLTASGANGTVLQAITSGSAARITSAYVRRKTGTGVINMTQDNGTTWTVITPQAYWSQIPIPSATTANPTVGFRIVASGDAIEVDYVQHELGSFVTSPIGTTTAAVTRDADLERPPTTWVSAAGPQTTLIQFVKTSPAAGDEFLLAATTNGRALYVNPSNQAGIYDGTTNVTTAAAVTSNVQTGIATRYGSSAAGVCFNGGTIATGAFDGSMGAGGAVGIGDDGAGGSGFSGLITRISIASSAANDADLQAASAGTL